MIKIKKHRILLSKTSHGRQELFDVVNEVTTELSEVLFITSYPPRECGIATYSQDLIKALNDKFNNSLSLKVCALEVGEPNYNYPSEVKYILDTSEVDEFKELAKTINNDKLIKIVLIQHEFGFFNNQEQAFMSFLFDVTKPVVIVFHSVLPRPDKKLKAHVKGIAACGSVIVMTHNSAEILINDYDLPANNISVIPHGTHLVLHLSEKYLKSKYGLIGRKVLTTFGLLSSRKSIETTLEAMPAIIKKCPEVVFLIIGKTHPEVKKHEGEEYREKLERKVVLYSLQNHVIFINDYLALPELLEYLQITDIYLFTSNDPNQAVSGTIAYAMSCACPIISTPIPHAKELLTDDTGIIFDFNNSQQLSDAVIRLLSDNQLRKNLSSNTLHKIISTAWENSAVSHAMLFEKIAGNTATIQYNLPDINLAHIKLMTTETGIIQFSKINQPDLESGYTLNDNAMALIAMCMHFQLTGNNEDLVYIQRYFDFIKLCLQPNGKFLNYVDKNLIFTAQNNETNLDDANGRAIWALGYLSSFSKILPPKLLADAVAILTKTLKRVDQVHSTHAMAFAIKGIYYFQSYKTQHKNLLLIETLASRLVQMYKHESKTNWEWFESYLTYPNSFLPEAMLYAWKLTGKETYKKIALQSFNFLLTQTFNENGIDVKSNKSWLDGEKNTTIITDGGEQPIDVAYTIMAIDNFYNIFQTNDFREKIVTAFNWFLGSNRLKQIIYNPCTGGCYDGLEETHVNINQGAESTISYLLARLTIEKYKKKVIPPSTDLHTNYAKRSKKEEAQLRLSVKNSQALASYYFITNSYGVTKKEIRF